MFFGCLDGELAVESFADAEIELARIGPRGQWLGDRLAAAVQVFNDLVHQIAEAVLLAARSEAFRREPDDVKVVITL